MCQTWIARSSGTIRQRTTSRQFESQVNQIRQVYRNLSELCCSTTRERLALARWATLSPEVMSSAWFERTGVMPARGVADALIHCELL